MKVSPVTETTATQIVSTLTGRSFAAFTLAYGYAVDYNGKRELFEAGRGVTERRNERGRVTHAVFEYKDGSALTYQWNEARGFCLTTKKH